MAQNDGQWRSVNRGQIGRGPAPGMALQSLQGNDGTQNTWINQKSRNHSREGKEQVQDSVKLGIDWIHEQDRGVQGDCESRQHKRLGTDQP